MIGQKLTPPPEQQDVFTDILFNALLGFAFMFAIAFTLIRPESTTGKITPKAEFLITAQWQNDHPDDVDLIVEDGQGNIVWFDEREAGLMHLDRDDRGFLGDHIIVDGKRVHNPINQETVSLRGTAEGEYVVNLLHYKAQTARPVSIQVKIEKLNPKVQLVYSGVTQLNGAGDEKTAIRFTLDNNGKVTKLYSRAKPLIRNNTFKARGQ